MKNNSTTIKKQNAGFTMIELMISSSILILLGMMLMTVIGQNVTIWRLQESLANVNASLRNTEMQVSQEVREASLNGDAAIGVQGFTVTPNVITFQLPLTPDGQTWTTPVSIQIRNEDVNANLLLDAGEDLNGNGILDRVIERLQDGIGANAPDGDFNDAGETRTLVQNVDALAFALIGNRLNTTVTCRRRTSDMNTNAVTDTLSFSVFLVN